MIKSMTGYGKAETEIRGKKIKVEIRSLNSKQLDLSMRVPHIYRQTEYEIRSEASKALKRGKIDITVSYETASGANTAAINERAFRDYFAQLKAIGESCGIDPQTIASTIIPSILRLPEVVQTESIGVPEDETAALLAASRAALEHIDLFRAQEGVVLMADMLRRIDAIEQLAESIIPYEEARTEAIKKRMRDACESMRLAIDQNRLEQEMIYYIEKLDITEEKVRLGNHCSYFRQVASQEEDAGRKLGFIAQEMGREINTMGSKSNESAMQKMVVQMKDELEKIKEQLLNIL